MEALAGVIVGSLLGILGTYYVQKNTLEMSLKHQSNEASLDRKLTRDIELLRHRLNVYTTHVPALMRETQQAIIEKKNITAVRGYEIMSHSLAITTVCTKKVNEACQGVIEHTINVITKKLSDEDLQTNLGQSVRTLVDEIQKECGIINETVDDSAD